MHVQPTGVYLLVLGMGLAACSRGTPMAIPAHPSRTAPPETPHGAMIVMERAKNDGDDAAFFDRILVTDPTLERSARATFAVDLGASKLRHALFEIFGEDNSSAFANFATLMEQSGLDEKYINDTKVTIDGDHATAEETPRRYFVKMDGQWKLDFANSYPRLADDVAAQYLAEGEFDARLAAAVRAGKFKTREDVRAEASTFTGRRRSDPSATQEATTQMTKP